MLPAHVKWFVDIVHDIDIAGIGNEDVVELMER
jgi:hypothetical protein